MGSSLYFTVYSAELLGILVAMTYIKGVFLFIRGASRFYTFYIFIDNQAAIRTIRDPGISLGQAITAIIIQILDDIRARGITVILH